VWILSAVCLRGCTRGTQPSDESNRLVVFVSADDFLARQVIHAFEEETGIRVEMVGDSEANKTTGLVTRIRNERYNPVADVFWSSEAFMMIQLADEGLSGTDLARGLASSCMRQIASRKNCSPRRGWTWPTRAGVDGL
jgi:ABC-type molybdate transport system substrate-binding protein